MKVSESDSRFFEQYSGSDKFIFKKKLTSTFLLHRENRDLSYNKLGLEVNNQLQTRDNTIRTRNNEVPVPQVRVGSGIRSKL